MNAAAMAGHSARIVQLSMEHARLKRVVEPYERLKQLRTQMEEADAIVADPAADADLRTLAEAELPALRAEADRLGEGLMDDLVTGEEAAVDSIILEIRAGTGGEEAALFAADLLRMYEAFARAHGLKWEVMDLSPSDKGGFREVIVSVKGPDVYRLL